MKISNVHLNNLGTVNRNEVVLESDNGKIVLYFSYETIVGIEKNGQTYCLKNYWGPTTGKLLNDIEPDKGKRLDQEDFDKVLSSIFNDNLNSINN